MPELRVLAMGDLCVQTVLLSAGLFATPNANRRVSEHRV